MPGGAEEASDAAEAAAEAARSQAQQQRRMSQVAAWQCQEHQRWGSSTGSEDTAAARGRLSMTQMLSADLSDEEGAGGSQGRPQLARQQAEQQASACNTAGAGDDGNHGVHEVQQQGQAAVATASAEQHSDAAEPGG